MTYQFKEGVEVWRDAAGYEGRYQVSDHGRVRNSSLKVKRPQLVNSGYLVVHLYSGGKHTRKIATVHKLVALAFVDNPANKPEVNHRNGNKADNTAGNIEWSTRLENVTHSISTGLIPPDQKRQPVIGFPVAGGMSINFSSLTEAEIHLSGKKTSAIQHSMGRKNGTAYGYSWSLLPDFN